MPKRKVFYSFHYDKDNWRASQVRNIGVVEGNEPVSDNEWEKVKQGGDQAIRNWIDKNLENRTCTIVLVGQETANRKWVKYEIEKSWTEHKGVVGIRIHNLKDRMGNQAYRGPSPFENITVDNNNLNFIVECYDPPYWQSNDVYNDISKKLESLIENAIIIRNRY